MPATFFCETRMSGAGGKTATGWEPCGLWQSTQVACRLLLSSVFSAASCGLAALGKGWPILGAAYSENTLANCTIGEMLEPLWQAMQSCSFWPRSRRAGPVALCGAWQAIQASAATVV